MAGTIVADTIQDGAGNSTSMDNAIYGSAKAWVRYLGASGTIQASYNVSSVTRSSTGVYTVNMTNAMSDTNYSVIAATSSTATSSGSGQSILVFTDGSVNTITPTTSAFGIMTAAYNYAAIRDSYYITAAVFR